MGAGGFGAVYRGMQPDGTEIAIKALEGNEWPLRLDQLIFSFFFLQ